ncbi:MAG: CxxC-x17-CxxC domain-containing protein [Candidatus Magasanikbacteria bacterium]
MGNFRRDDSRSSGGFSRGNKSFGGGSRFGGRDGDRDGGRPAMHRATCSECGDNCEVPFKLTGDKPIFCSDCFGRQKSRDGGRDSGSSRPSYGGDRHERRERRERPSFDRGDRQMHDAVCAKCGDDCQVPFKPTSAKPVYCSNCFEKSDRTGGGRGAGQSSDQLNEINAKLDLIMIALGLSPVKKAKEEKAKKTEVKEVEENKEVETKTPSKKAVKKKETKEIKEKKVKKKSATKKVAKKVVAKKKK